MKIAVLISGEYRKFGICRKNMSFLDDSRVDIYFSTWDKTIYSLPKINFHKEEDVTLERVKHDLGKDAVIEIEPHDLFQEIRYNSKMIHRWKRGFELIKNSGIKYDYVLITRPDLYFELKPKTFFDNIENYKNSLGAGWFHDTRPDFLPDIVMLSSYERMNNLFEALSVDVWTKARNKDWHSWWSQFPIPFFESICNFKEMGSPIFCRYFMNEDMSFKEKCDIQTDWDDLKVLAIMDYIGEKKARLSWSHEIVDRILKNWNSRYYYKYMSQKIAIVISGMLRNYDTAVLSLPIWGYCDRYLVTWESAGQEAINEYCAMADIKEKFIIPDEEFETLDETRSYNNNHNTFKMVYLWSAAYKNMPKDYDRYIFIRPDGFYWCINPKKLSNCISTEGPFKVNQTRSNLKQISDNILFVDKTHLNILEDSYSKLNEVCLNMIKEGRATNEYGDYLGPHDILYEMWKQNIPKEKYNSDEDFFSENIYRCIEPIWVRDSFIKLDNDRYNQDLYHDIFYDTAAHWRRNARCRYTNILNRLEQGL
jgi:hypothetical protein